MELVHIQFTPAPVTSTALGLNILFSTLSSNTLSMFFPQRESKSVIQITFLFTFSFLHFFYGKEEEKNIPTRELASSFCIPSSLNFLVYTILIPNSCPLAYDAV